MQSACLGSLTDEDGGKCYSVFSQPEQKIVAKDISLREVLGGSRSAIPKRSERFQIALAVASSHLQLQSTKWARKQWEAGDIRFPETTGERSQIMFDKPYVSADFNALPGGAAQVPKMTDRSFACLGIMLLELLFGQCLEGDDLWEHFGVTGSKSAPLRRLMVARQWADAVEGEAGPDFSAVVKWCLNDSPTTLYGEQWRHDLAERVVLPLQNCCRWISGSLQRDDPGDAREESD
jgi:hypothetical protein